MMIWISEWLVLSTSDHEVPDMNPGGRIQVRDQFLAFANLLNAG